MRHTRQLGLLALLLGLAPGCTTSNGSSTADGGAPDAARDGSRPTQPDAAAGDAAPPAIPDGGRGSEASIPDGALSDSGDSGVCAPSNTAWAVSGGGAGQDDAVYGVAGDKDGNVWVTGTFIGQAKWGSVSLAGVDKVHTTIFVAKLDSQGDVLFARSLGTLGIGQRVRLDAEGNAYVAGTFHDSISLDGVSVTQDNAGGGGAAFVYKFDPKGKALWGIASANRGGSDEVGNDVAIDPKNGDVYLVGSYNGFAVFNNPLGDGGVSSVLTTQAAGGDEKAFVAKYSQQHAQWEWAKGWIGSDNDGGYTLGVAMNPDDTVTVVGQIHTEISIDGAQFPSEDGSFVVKLAASDGRVVWKSQIDGGGRNDNGKKAIVHAAVSDAAGNLYVTGEFNATASFGGAPSAGDAGVADAGAGVTLQAVNDDMFIAKYGPGGDALWAKRAGSSQTGITRGNDIALDGRGGLYVTGFHQGATVFDQKTLTSTGNEWVARYDTDGSLVWVTGNDNDHHAGGEGLGVFASPSNGVLVGGSYVAKTAFGAVGLTSAGQDDAFVARFCN